MNPMVRKELRQRMRDRRAWLLPTLYLGVLGAVVAMVYFFQTQDFTGLGQGELQGAEIGVTVFYTAIFTQMAVLLLLAPVFSAGSVTIEKEQRTLAGLITSLLTSTQIWWGKYAAALLFLVLLMVSALPVLSLSFALGGVSPWELIKTVGVTLLVLASMVAVGLYCSSYFRRSVHATAVTYGVTIALTVISAVAFFVAQRQWMKEVENKMTTTDVPFYVMAPLYFNPFFALGAVLTGEPGPKFPHWARSLLFFTVLGLIASVLAVRNIGHSREQL